jgi:hypothetical protein
VRFEVSKFLRIHVVDLLVRKSCNPIGDYRCFGEKYYLHLQGKNLYVLFVVDAGER